MPRRQPPPLPFQYLHHSSTWGTIPGPFSVWTTLVPRATSATPVFGRPLRASSALGTISGPIQYVGFSLRTIQAIPLSQPVPASVQACSSLSQPLSKVYPRQHHSPMHPMPFQALHPLPRPPKPPTIDPHFPAKPHANAFHHFYSPIPHEPLKAQSLKDANPNGNVYKPFSNNLFKTYWKMCTKPRQLLHQAPFTPSNFYTRHLSDQTAFRPDTCYTKQLLHQALFTPRNFYTRRLSHQATFAPDTFQTKQVLHQTPFTPSNLLHQAPFTLNATLLFFKNLWKPKAPKTLHPKSQTLKLQGYSWGYFW